MASANKSYKIADQSPLLSSPDNMELTWSIFYIVFIQLILTVSHYLGYDLAKIDEQERIYSIIGSN